MSDLWFNMVVGLVLGYALGAIPFGLLLTRLSGGGDIRTIGSGNIGATNVLRTGRKGMAALTLIFGHLYPVWLRFKGGKGSATYGGILFGLFWQGGVIYAIIWFGVLIISRLSSGASLTAALSAPIAAVILGYYDLVPILSACTLIIFWKHRGNIERLIAGTEPRIGKSKS